VALAVGARLARGAIAVRHARRGAERAGACKNTAGGDRARASCARVTRARERPQSFRIE
jgi:hypothetical protein